MPKNIDEVIQHPTWRKVKEVEGAFTIRDARMVTGRFGECIKLDLADDETGEAFAVSLGISDPRQQLVDYFASMGAESVGPCRFETKTIQSGQWQGSEYWDIVSADSETPNQPVRYESNQLPF